MKPQINSTHQQINETYKETLNLEATKNQIRAKKQEFAPEIRRVRKKDLEEIKDPEKREKCEAYLELHGQHISTGIKKSKKEKEVVKLVDGTQYKLFQ